MTEAEVINRSSSPITREQLVGDLQALGVSAGMTLLVHSSLSALGWVCGGPVAVIQALMDVVTPAGTLVMPTHSADYSDPITWGNPAVPAHWIPIIRASMPVFEPASTPSRGMGQIPEIFRTWPSVLRSAHPTVSFGAWGRHAATVTHDHALAFGLGEASPLARIYTLDGSVLLLGAGFGSNTSFHLAEYRIPTTQQVKVGAPILEDGQRVWRVFPDIEMDTEPFEAIGAAFQDSGAVQQRHVGLALARLFSQRAAVDFAQQWLLGRATTVTGDPRVIEARCQTML